VHFGHDTVLCYRYTHVPSCKGSRILNMNLVKLLGDGQRYMKIWPMVRQLGFYFPEYRVVKATQLAIIAMPVLALVVAASQLYIFGWDYLPQALTMLLFFISLPLQGLLWLGWRASHPLPLSLFDWGNQLSSALTEMGIYCQPLGAKACYSDMATILKLAFERLDQSYWDEL
jgi:uncharacterized membrane protein YfbV (UPF0208 family)